MSTQPAVQGCVCFWSCLCLWMCLAHVPVSLGVQGCVSVPMCLLVFMWMFYMSRFIGMCFLFPDRVYLTLCRPRGVWVRTFHPCVCQPHMWVWESVSLCQGIGRILRGELDFGGFILPSCHRDSMDHFMYTSVYFDNLDKTQAIDKKLGRHLTNTALSWTEDLLVVCEFFGFSVYATCWRWF